MEEMSIGEFARRSRLSPKALRLYDGLGVLSPARVDELSGYRYYTEAQLDQARLIAALRQLGVPLAAARDVLGMDAAQMAEWVTAWWREAETRHTAQRELVTALVDRLTGRMAPMYEVSTRDVPRRSLLCLKRHVDEAGAWALGKEFVALLRDPRMPPSASRENATFAIYWGQVSADSDGPVEWCKPVPEAEAESLAAQFPELTLRVEPAHREAYVDIGKGGETTPAQFQLADEALRAWAEEDQRLDPAKLSIRPEELGMRITYFAGGPPGERTSPDCDFAVPFA